jgi:4-hydroxymandelate oxidase
LQPTDWVSLPHLEELAREILPRGIYDFIESGAADEHTIRWNRDAFARIRLRPRVLQDVANVDTGVTLLGDRLRSPILLAPTAYHRMLHPDGELATAAGAGAAGIPWVVSTSTNTSIEDIAAATSAPLWFQLYVQSDREFTRDLVQRAQAAGCRALCLTVDTPVLGARDRQRRSGFALPPGMPTPHLHDVNSGRREVADLGRVVVTWSDVEWLRSLCRVPLVLKGILDPRDAARALLAGADALIVSNHGGRNLDTVPATIEALTPIVEEVAGRIPILMDGGVRRGTDILKALALGATAVLIGRPYCYALALAGGPGVTRAVELLEEELVMALMLTGCAKVSEVTRDVLW